MLTELHIVQNGRGHPVVLTSGLGLCWFDWDAVTRLLASNLHVIRFDRPGIGGNSAAGVPSLEGEVSRIAGLIRGLDLSEPVLVAHSVAALHAEALARLHPDLLGGLVLVDPSCEAAGSHAGRRLVRFRQRLAVAVLASAGALDRVALSRRIGPTLRRALVRRQTTARKDPADAHDVAACYGSGQALAAILAEYLMYRPMVDELAALRPGRSFPPIPLTVLTATGDMSATAARGWRHCHQRLAALAPGGSWAELPDSGHLIQLDRPRVVADAVVSQVCSIRKQPPA